jgi:IS5 family transposase
LLGKIIAQIGINFHPGTLAETIKYYEPYARISEILDDNPEILDLVHRDIANALDSYNDDGRRSRISAENVLRTAIAQVIENEPLRRIVMRIDESDNMRQFVRIYNEDMFSYATFCALRNHIRPETWTKINRMLAVHAIEQEYISGEKLRIDTTAVETNIHYPTDSSLLADTYRVMARLIGIARKIDPDLVGKRRLRERKVKRLHASISRKATKKGELSREAKKLYRRLFELVEGILALALEVRDKLAAGGFTRPNGRKVVVQNSMLTLSIEHFHELGQRVLDQARRRVIDDETVPSKEKLYSIFEPHTELIKRGKAGKLVEFGHMVLIEQVEGKLITGYEVFEHKPNDKELVDPALKNHEELFGTLPEKLSADKGFYESMEKIKELEEGVGVVSICKKGKRTEQEKERESSKPFTRAQRFRAGIEGTISVLKRALGMFRCMTKGWRHFKATIGRIIFAHNLLVLARG